MRTKRITLNELKNLVKKIITESLPIGNSRAAQSAAQTLNSVIGRINNPELSKEARVHASEIIRLIDEDQK